MNSTLKGLGQFFGVMSAGGRKSLRKNKKTTGRRTSKRRTSKRRTN